MPKFLMIETSTRNCSVAISEGEKLLYAIDDVSEKYSHAERLHRHIDNLMKRAGWSYADLDAVGVGSGPGSYTGLRIGVSAAKGFAYVLKIPVVTVMSLETLARGVRTEKGFIVPMIDARRMEAYTAVYDADYRQVREVEAEILDEHSFAGYLDKTKVYFAGDAVPKLEKILSHANAVFPDIRYPSAKNMLPVVLKKFTRREFENTAYFEPFYLKDFIVKRKKKPLI